MSKRDDAEDRCSGCNGRKADTCKAKNRCGCEDGQDGSAHWVRSEDLCPTCEDGRCRGEDTHRDAAVAELTAESQKLGLYQIPALPTNEKANKLVDRLVTKANKKNKRAPIKKRYSAEDLAALEGDAVPLAGAPRHFENKQNPNIPKQDEICPACKQAECWGDCPEAKVAPLVKAREEKKAKDEKTEGDLKKAIGNLPEAPKEGMEW